MQRPGAGERILFLDYDGCLHPADVRVDMLAGLCTDAPGHTVFEHAELLVQLLAPHPDWLIVLSTTWAFRYGTERARAFLPPELQKRVIGCTCDYAGPGFERLARGAQVANDVKARAPRDWVAIDDDARGWPRAAKGRFVQSDAVEGIAAPVVREQLAAALSRRPRRR